MARTFAYVRVSTVGQTTQNQIDEISAAGFSVQPRRIISETISGSTPISKRPEFNRLVDRLEEDDVLIVTKLDRLGRDAVDVTNTVKILSARGVRVHCLALGGVDLTSSAGMMTMQVINAVAQFERDLIIERTSAGLARAKLQGKVLGRRPHLGKDLKDEVRQALIDGKITITALAKKYGTSRQTILRCKQED